MSTVNVADSCTSLNRANMVKRNERERNINSYKTKVSFHVGLTPLIVFVRCVCPDPMWTAA
jgi:hypothetical protein